MRQTRLVIDREQETSAVLREYSPLTRRLGMAAVGFAVVVASYAMVSGAVTYRDAFQRHAPNAENLPPAEAPEIPDASELQPIVDATYQQEAGE